MAPLPVPSAHVRVSRDQSLSHSDAHRTEPHGWAWARCHSPAERL